MNYPSLLSIILFFIVTIVLFPSLKRFVKTLPETFIPKNMRTNAFMFGQSAAIPGIVLAMFYGSEWLPEILLCMLITAIILLLVNRFRIKEEINTDKN